MTDKYYVTDELGNKTHVLVPTRLYDQLVEQAESLRDAAELKYALEDDDEIIPGEMVTELAGGKNPVRIWRQYRGLSASTLAEKAGLSTGYVSMIESGKRVPSVKSLKVIADVLRVEIDDLVWD